MSELRTAPMGEGLKYFFCYELEVDGIKCNLAHDSITVQPMLKAKNDIYDDEIENEVDGYLDDSDPESMIAVMWDSPYIPLPRSEGEIDMDIYMKYGVVVGLEDPAYDQVRRELELM